MRSLRMVLLAALAAACAASAIRATAAPPRRLCDIASGVSAWSPDGKQIAYVGRLRAICIASPDGSNAKPLPHTECIGPCAPNYGGPVNQLEWVKPRLLLFLDNFTLFALQPNAKPRRLGKVQGGIEEFAVDRQGDRVALGSSVCPNCHGPVTVLSVPSGKVVGQFGGTSEDNDDPALSPDGKRLAFWRSPDRGSPVWTAASTGGHLRPLKGCGDTPIWSPRGTEIACSGLSPLPPHHCCAVTLVAAGGGSAATIVPRGARPQIFSWSPNGRYVAFLAGHCDCRLAVVDVRTKKQHRLDAVSPRSVSWSPDSKKLLVSVGSRAVSYCALLWEVPVDGGKATRLRTCPYASG